MNSSPRLAWGRVLTGVVAAIVLSVGAFALIRGDDGDDPSPTPPTSTSTPASTVPATGEPTTVPNTTVPNTTVPNTTVPNTTVPEPQVGVPNVVGLSREDALTALQTAGLDAHIESLPIASAPPGFVLSQTPLPATQIGVGSAVALVVSTAP